MEKSIEYLKLVDDVISRGVYKDTWESLCTYPEQVWYKNAKFGIFIHWGVYAVPAFAHEWYSRQMYVKDSDEYKHHVKTYGAHKDFGYKDFIPMFKGESFNADEWISLFKKAGAKYMIPVAEHHDGFQMYGSELSKWNAEQMGPCRDVIGLLKKSAEKSDMILGVSNHRAEHYWFFNGGLEYESDVNNPDYEDFYDKQHGGMGQADDFDRTDIYPPPVYHLEDWLARNVEIVEKYKPTMIYFDWWIQQEKFEPYLKKFAAYYYNRAIELGFKAAINYKRNSFAPGSAIFDVERGHLDSMRTRFWQTCTAAARNSWCYTESNDYKKPVELVCDLVDVVSKNGCMLLNVGPKADGTIPDEDKNILLEIGKWLEINGEGIYNTSCWNIFGEGLTNVKGGGFTDSESTEYTSDDIRFTYNSGAVYAFVMKFPKNGVVSITTMKNDSSMQGSGLNPGVKKVSLIGFDNPISFSADKKALKITVTGDVNTDYPVCFKLTMFE